MDDQKALKALTPRELKRRAVELGATHDDIEALDDADDVKAAAIELVLKATLAAAQPSEAPFARSVVSVPSSQTGSIHHSHCDNT